MTCCTHCMAPVCSRCSAASPSCTCSRRLEVVKTDTVIVCVGLWMPHVMNPQTRSAQCSSATQHTAMPRQDSWATGNRNHAGLLASLLPGRYSVQHFQGWPSGMARHVQQSPNRHVLAWRSSCCRACRTAACSWRAALSRRCMDTAEFVRRTVAQQGMHMICTAAQSKSNKPEIHRQSEMCTGCEPHRPSTLEP